jgi:hypothetical protein
MNWNNYCLRDNAICGKIPSGGLSQTVFRENFMSRTLDVALPAALLCSALALSACATKTEPPPVAPRAQVETVTETPAAPVATPEPQHEPSPAPVAAPEPALAPVITEPPVRKQEAPKAKKKTANHTPAKGAPPAPVATPVAVPAPVAPIVIPPPPPEPSKPITIESQPVKKVAEPGFLERYWIWLLGLIIVIAGIIVWRMKSQGRNS